MKKVSKKIYFVGIISAIILFSAFKATESSYNNNMSPSSNGITTSGEEMFEGIFFSQGNFVTLLPQLNNARTCYNLNQTKIQEKTNLATYCENYLKGKDANYFINFKNSLKGSTISQYDPILENASIDLIMSLLSNDDILNKFVKVYDLNKNEIKEYVQNGNRAQIKLKLNALGNELQLGNKNCLLIVVVVVIAAVETAVVVNSVAAVTVAVKIWAVTSSVDSVNPLTHEGAVAELYQAVSQID